MNFETQIVADAPFEALTQLDTELQWSLKHIEHGPERKAHIQKKIAEVAFERRSQVDEVKDILRVDLIYKNE